jgi:hypothetical protein
VPGRSHHRRRVRIVAAAALAVAPFSLPAVAGADDAFPGPVGWGRLPSLGLTVGVGHGGAALRDGNVLLAGGSSFDVLAAPLTRSEVVNVQHGRHRPGEMTFARDHPRLIALQDGRVLAVGPGRETELYEPVTGAWAAAAPMAVDHGDSFGIARLKDGRVLVAGGRPTTSDEPTNRVEIFDPLIGGWSDAPPLDTARSLTTAVALPDGGAVVIGGEDRSKTPLRSVERLQPGVDGGWRVASPMPLARVGAAAVLLSTENRVLVAGGVAVEQPPLPPDAPPIDVGDRGADAVDLYDIVLDGWLPAASLDRVNPRFVMLLPLGDRTAIASDGGVLDRYDPELDRWFRVPLPPGGVRRGSTITRFTGGRLLLSGGRDGAGAPRRDAVVLGPVARLGQLDIVPGAVTFSSSGAALVALKLRRASGGVVAQVVPASRVVRPGKNRVALRGPLPLGRYRLELTPRTKDGFLTGPPVILDFRATRLKLVKLGV